MPDGRESAQTQWGRTHRGEKHTRPHRVKACNKHEHPARGIGTGAEVQVWRGEILIGSGSEEGLN